jgi:hypothetical protein
MSSGISLHGRAKRESLCTMRHKAESFSDQGYQGRPIMRLLVDLGRAHPSAYLNNTPEQSRGGQVMRVIEEFNLLPVVGAWTTSGGRTVIETLSGFARSSPMLLIHLRVDGGGIRRSGGQGCQHSGQLNEP